MRAKGMLIYFGGHFCPGGWVSQGQTTHGTFILEMNQPWAPDSEHAPNPGWDSVLVFS